MYVDITISEKKSFLISDEDLKNITENHLRKLFKINKDMFIDENDNLVEECGTGGGSHSWYEKSTIRKATEEDKAFFIIWRKLCHGTSAQ